MADERSPAEMSESEAPITDVLTSLEDAASAAHERYVALKTKRKHERYELPKEVTADLVAFRDDLAFKRPGYVPEGPERVERQRELTRELFEKLDEAGLVVEAVDRGGIVAIIDAAERREVVEAELEAREAKQRVAEFREENGDALRAERQAAEAKRIREALEGDDPEAMREAILGSKGGGALTTEDAKPSRKKRIKQRVTSA